jgi:amino acid transporter
VGLDETERPGGALTFGFALALFGGPLAIPALYAAGVAGPALPSVGLAALLATIVFCLPILVWWRYSARVSSGGGLVAWVREAAGTRPALVAGVAWTVSYFLYLPYTVTDIAYEGLPVVFPGISGTRWILQLVLPLAVTAVALLPLRWLFAGFAAAAATQLALLLGLGVVLMRHVGAPASSFAVHGSAGEFKTATLGLSLLFVCGSLPFFFGDEVRGGGRTLRRAVAAAFVVAAAYALFATFPLAAVPRSLLGGAIPGYDVATAYAGRGFGIAVGLGAISTDAVLLLAELLALSRLLAWATGRSPRTTTLWIAVPFFLADAVALALDPAELSERAIRPSLFALWLSQLAVFAAFPLLRRRRADLVLAAACSALAVWALYRVVTVTTAS